MGSREATPYWNVNVPKGEQTEECPDFLLQLTAKDLGVISTLDEEYKTQSWALVRGMVERNSLAGFQRRPSDLRRYLAYMHKLRREYGSVTRFMVETRLGWETPVTAKGGPFEYPEDFKVLHNDWPYGIDPRIVHLVVWTKFKLKDDPVTGLISEETKKVCQKFIDETFSKQVPRDQMVWFKNWSSLKSVHAVEHIHVLLFDPDPKFIQDVTNGDLPQCSKQDS